MITSFRLSNSPDLSSSHPPSLAIEIFQERKRKRDRVMQGNDSRFSSCYQHIQTAALR